MKAFYVFALVGALLIQGKKITLDDDLELSLGDDGDILTLDNEKLK
jgi:hypothetical protein